MHRHDALRRQEEVEQAEHRLLHFAGISGAADQDQLLFQIDRDHRLAAAAVTRRIGAEARQVDDRIFGHEAGQLAGFGPDQHRADEQVVPGKFVDHADADAMLGLRAAEQILDEQGRLVCQRGEEIVVQAIERVGVHRPVRLAPPDRVFADRVADDEAVVGAAPGVLAGADDQRAILGEQAFAARGPHARPSGAVVRFQCNFAPVPMPWASSRCAGIRSLTINLPKIKAPATAGSSAKCSRPGL